MRPEQLADLTVPSHPVLHPDGERIAFVVTGIDLDADRYVRRIWLWDGERARPLTSGAGDTSPAWSPDGTRLAFLRKAAEPGAVAQVAVLPLDGGEASCVTSFGRGAFEVAWSPDGSSLGVVGAEWIDELVGLEDEERARRPRLIDRLPYRFDNAGWIHERRKHLFLVDPTGESEPYCLTPGEEYEESSLVWHPSGEELSFVSARHDGRELEPGTQVWSVRLADGGVHSRTAVGVWSHPSYDLEGNLYATGTPDQWSHPAPQPLQRIAGDGVLTDLTGHLDRNLVTPSPPVTPPLPQWLDDGSALSTIESEGRSGAVRIAGDGSVTAIVSGDRVVTGIAARRDGSAFAFVATSPTDPGELWWWEDGEERRLTSLQSGFTGAAGLAAPSRFVIEHDGVEIEGWIYLPPGTDRVPVLLNIHGGPATQYGYQFFDEFQVYVGAGYGVVAINPRGSSGYGAGHVTSVVGTWFEPSPPDLRDLLAAVDAAIAQEPRLDGDAVGVMGGSYGGLASVRVIAADHRYRSCVAERGLYVWPSFVGTSDIGPWFDRTYLGTQLPDGWEQLRLASSAAYAETISTPTLIVHSDGDWRCPAEQAEQLFVALKRFGVETRLVRFPVDEGHELSRSGSPRHRVERFELILDWHRTHLS